MGGKNDAAATRSLLMRVFFRFSENWLRYEKSSKQNLQVLHRSCYGAPSSTLIPFLSIYLYRLYRSYPFIYL